MTKGEVYSNFDLFFGLTKKNGYKAGTFYSYKPTDGTGDFQWSRAVAQNRIDQAGATELMAINVPRVDYSQTCPQLLIQTDNSTWEDVAFNDLLDYTSDEGTIFIRCNLVFSEDIQGIVTLSDAGIFDDYLAIYNIGAGGTKKIILTTYTNPDQNDVEVVVPEDGQYNIAFAYKLSTFEYSLAINGVVESTGTFANNVPSGASLDRFYLGKLGTSYMENSGIVGGGYIAQKLDDTSLENITA